MSPLPNSPTSLPPASAATTRADQDAVQELAAKLDYPEPLDWNEVLAAAERDSEWAERIGRRRDLYLRYSLERADTIKRRYDWLTADDDDAKFARRVEARRATLSSPALPSIEPPISVEALAEAIGRTVGTTRRLLDQGHILGAERKTPGVPNSPWVIPASSPARFLEGRS